MDVIINKYPAETVYIRDPETSYAIFCFNNVGDLFVNSDYGSYNYAWRNYGEDFKKFLSETNAEYIINKFEINFRNTSGKKIPKYWHDCVLNLIRIFISHLQTELQNPNK